MNLGFPVIDMHTHSRKRTVERKIALESLKIIAKGNYKLKV